MLKVGIFSFAGCEGCVVEFVELLNDNFEKWKGLIDFRYAKILKSNNDLRDLDVAFIEGAIASEKDVERIKEIRGNCKKLVAIGTCATMGQPAGQRNFFDEEKKKEVQFLVERFHQLPKVLSVKEVVKVDMEVPGCPMIDEKFLEVLDSLLKEFRVVENAP